MLSMMVCHVKKGKKSAWSWPARRLHQRGRACKTRMLQLALQLALPVAAAVARRRAVDCAASVGGGVALVLLNPKAKVEKLEKKFFNGVDVEKLEKHSWYDSMEYDGVDVD